MGLGVTWIEGNDGLGLNLVDNGLIEFAFVVGLVTDGGA
jgi:hypothetical protein